MIINNKGIGIIEIIVVVAIAGIALFGISGISSYALGVMNDRKALLEAEYLAEEGMEAVRSVRDESWTANIAALAMAVNYYPVIFGSKWTLSATNPGLINGRYARRAVFENVNRDGSDNIVSSGGTLDSNTKKVTVYVSWTEKNGNKEISLITYLTNWR